LTLNPRPGFACAVAGNRPAHDSPPSPDSPAAFLESERGGGFGPALQFSVLSSRGSDRGNLSASLGSTRSSRRWCGGCRRSTCLTARFQPLRRTIRHWANGRWRGYPAKAKTQSANTAHWVLCSKVEGRRDRAGSVAPSKNCLEIEVPDLHLGKTIM